MDADWHEETDDPRYADERNFYKVEEWRRSDVVGGDKRLLYASNNLERVRRFLSRELQRRPNAKLMIRQRTRVLQEWPSNR
jgi:hypothetical protein